MPRCSSLKMDEWMPFNSAAGVTGLKQDDSNPSRTVYIDNPASNKSRENGANILHFRYFANPNANKTIDLFGGTLTLVSNEL